MRVVHARAHAPALEVGRGAPTNPETKGFQPSQEQRNPDQHANFERFVSGMSPIRFSSNAPSSSAAARLHALGGTAAAALGGSASALGSTSTEASRLTAG